MKTKGLLRIVVLFFCVIGFSGCNDDESEFSSTEIQQALFDMKGTYKGAVEVSYYRGKDCNLSRWNSSVKRFSNI